MAWLEQKKSGTFHIVFRLGNEKYRRSLRTKNKREANSRCTRLDENLRLVESGRLIVPEEADLVSFLLSDGKLNGKVKSQKRVTLGKLFETYCESLPEGSLEANSLRVAAIHMRHLVRTIASNIDLRAIGLEHLQKHVNARSKEPGKYGKNVSAGTIKKEISTFRTIWNWAIGFGYVSTPFPNQGLKYPKMDEKLPFKTWDEIQRDLEQDEVSSERETELWHCLYLRTPELEEVLSIVKEQQEYQFLYPMVSLAAYTGARRSELCRSQVSDVDLKDGSILIREKKRNKSRRTYRRVPLTTPLQEILREWFSQKPKSRFTFPTDWKVSRSRRKTRENDGSASPEEASHHLERTLKLSKWKVICGWHVFRHSFISNCASIGVDQRMIDDWVGHQTDEQRQRYRHLFPDVQAAAIDRVFA